MGLGKNEISFLVAARHAGVDFGRTLMIGRQELFADAGGIVDAWAAAGDRIAEREARELPQADGFAERIFGQLGAAKIDSLDASSFEGATITHDLNHPIPETLQHRYSVVVDGGSIEHIFNVPQVFANYMNLVGEDGHVLIVTPGNNWFGHGLYQFSPDLFYRTLAPENGFEIQTLLLRHIRPGAGWRRVADPAVVGGRIGLSTPWVTQLYVLARRVSMVEPLQTVPQQSDYLTAWSGAGRKSAAGRRTHQLFPPAVRRAAGGAKMIAASLKGSMSDRSHFEKFDLAKMGR